MAQTNETIMDIHGQYDPSLPQKVFLGFNHLLAVLLAAWILFGGGFHVVSVWFHTESPDATTLRKTLLMTASVIYFTRILFTGYFMQRKMTWSEAAAVAFWLYILHLSFAVLGRTNGSPVGIIGIAGCILFLAGSYLNTASEFKRFLWKQYPENKGKLYTEGLFKYSMHINYFGDTVLFTGFALVTGISWSLILPGIMAMLFIFYQIPTLDAYLGKKYEDDFEEYAKNTSKFFPGIY